QRGQGNWEHREAIKEISAEETIFDGPFKIAIRGGDDSDVRLSGLTAADALELALLQGAQQSDLDTKWQFADLIEKQRACIRSLEPPNRSLRRPRKSARLVAEQLGRDQFIGKSREIRANHRMR